MSKIKYFIIISAVCLLISGIAYGKNSNIETINVNADVEYSIKYEEIAQNSDIIVLGSAVKDLMERQSFIKYASRPNAEGTGKPEMAESFYSLAEFKIDKIIKQNNNTSVNVNDIINIREHVAIIEQDKVKSKITFENYKELKKDEKVLLFLKKNDFGDYIIIRGNEGREPAKTDEEINKAVLKHKIK